MRNDLTKGPIFISLLSFALPTILGNLFTQFYNAADSIVVGRFVGSNALASVGACFSLQQAVNAIMAGLGNGSSVVCAQYIGAKDYEKCTKAIFTAGVLAAIVGIVLTVLSIAFSRTILILLDTPAEILEDAVLYWRIVSMGTIGHLLYNMGAAVLRGMGDAKRPFYYLVFCSVLNVILDLIAVVGFGMGVKGVAIATAIAQAVSAVLVVKNVVHFSEEVHVQKDNAEFVRRDALRIGQIGCPLAVQNFVVAIGSIILQVFINRFGTNMVAAGSLVIKVDGFIVLPLMALNSAMVAFVGQNVGAGNMGRIRKGVGIVTKFAAVVGLALGGILWVCGPQFVSFFTTNTEVIYISGKALKILAFFYWAMALQQCFTGTIMGMGKTMVLMIVSIISVIIRIPVAYVFGVMKDNFYGLYTGNITANILGCSLLALYFYRQVLRKNKQ